VYSNLRMRAQVHTLQEIAGRETKKDFAKKAKRWFELFDENRKDPAIMRASRILELLTTAERLRVEIFNRAFLSSARRDAGAEAFESANEPRPWPDGVIGDCRFSDPITREMNQEYRDCLTELHSRLQRYHWRFVVWDGGYQWLRRFMAPRNKGKGRNEQTEAYLVDQFVRLVPERLFSEAPSQLFYFRKCRDCSRWFYAVTEHQRFCGQACRRHYAAQSPGFKEKRRIYMREQYRPQQKEQQERSLRNARAAAKGAK